jgi:hypothetical protein
MVVQLIVFWTISHLDPLATDLFEATTAAVSMKGYFSDIFHTAKRLIDELQCH